MADTFLEEDNEWRSPLLREVLAENAAAKRQREELHRFIERAKAEGRFEVDAPHPWEPETPDFDKDAVYWERLDQLQSEGMEIEFAHPMAMAKSKATAELRASGFYDRPRRSASFSSAPSQRRTPANENKKPVALQTYRISEFVDVPIPPRKFLVPDLIPKGKTTLISGDGGTGKSLLAMMLGFSVSTGDPWIGLPVEEGAVLYLAAEDDFDELRRRFADIAGSQDATRDLDRLHVAPLVGLDPILGALDRQTGRIAETEMFKALRLKIDELQPTLLVLDTLADLFDGDEIKKEQARGFMAMLNRLAAATDVTIVVLSHPSQSGMASGTGTSGNSAWSNSVRSRLYLQEHDSDADMRVLTLKKANYARAGTKLLLRLQDGRFERVDEGQQQADDLGEAKREFLRLLEEFTRQGRAPSPNVSSTYAPKVFSEEQGVRISKQKFKSAMSALLRDGKIEIAEVGTPSRIRYHLAIVDASATADPLRAA